MFITLYASITWFRFNGYNLSTHQLVRHPGESLPSLFVGTKVAINDIKKKGKGNFLLDSGIKDDSYLYIIYNKDKETAKNK